MGKKVYLLVLSGTEVEEGGPVIIVNSQQTLFSQFCNKGLHLRNLANNIGFPAPLKHKESHLRRDYLDEPMLSIVTEVRYKATIVCNRGVILHLFCHECPLLDNKIISCRFKHN